MGSSLAHSLAATLLGLALAAWALSPYWPSEKAIPRLVRNAASGLRQLHSGHIGDYIAYLTFGTAALLAALVLLIHGLTIA